MMDHINFYANIQHGQEKIAEAEIRKYFYLVHQNTNSETDLKKSEYFNQQDGDFWEV